jgi:hypothetical protein
MNMTRIECNNFREYVNHLEKKGVKYHIQNEDNILYIWRYMIYLCKYSRVVCYVVNDDWIFKTPMTLIDRNGNPTTIRISHAEFREQQFKLIQMW